MIDLELWAPVMLGGILAGGSTGLLGTYIVGMRIPFLGICVSHAALAGAVFGSLCGLDGQMLLLPALAGAVATALLLGLLDPAKIRADTNIVMGILFSLTMGLTFLGIGLFSRLDRSDSEVLSLLWGSLTFCTWKDVEQMAVIAVILLLFVLLLRKEMRAIMFSREQAAAAGIHVIAIWTIFLVLASTVLTINLKTVGGLMIYSLMINPTAAAFQLTKGHNKTLLLSILFGAGSGLGGFLISLLARIPTGASIVLLSSLLVAVACLISYLRRRFNSRFSTTGEAFHRCR